jgi:hypothetical protein
MANFTVPMKIIRDRESFLEELNQGVALKEKSVSLLLANLALFAIYGLIIGAFHSVPQAFSSAIKLPILYMLTLIICFPALYIFSTLFGGRKSISQYFVLLLSSMAVISVLLLGFAPVTIFFMITAPDYLFFKLLNVIIFAITGFVGLKFFYQSMQVVADEAEGKETRINILKAWIILYAFVGSQLGWILRPFFGSPNSPFQIFRETTRGNFYVDVYNTIVKLFGLH